jgi:dienelactone hydrolase
VSISTQTMEYCDGDTELSGFLAWDDTQDHRRPGVLVVHGGAGLDDHAKGRAIKLAKLGFVVFACDMYGKGVAGNRERVMTRITEFRRDISKLCQRARAGIKVLASYPQVDGRVAAVGYCFGGMAVLELVRNGTELAGVVSVHGSLHTSQPLQPGVARAKILVCHGALDPHVPKTQVSAFVEEMNHAGADWQLIVYGGAMHGFTHEAGPQLPGVAYHAIADARSSSAIQSFFVELFGQDSNMRQPVPDSF